MLALLAVLARNLLATILIEAALAWAAFGVRTWKGLQVVVLAQVVTNPLVELGAIALRWNPFAPPTSPGWVGLACLEIAAFVVEALLYRRAEVVGRPWLVSGVLNLASFVIGLVWAYLVL